MDEHRPGDDRATAAANPPALNLEESVYARVYALYRDAENLLAGNNRNHPRLLRADLRRMRHELDQALHALAEVQPEPEPTGPARPGRAELAEQVHIIWQGRGLDRAIIGVHRTRPGAVRAMAEHIRTHLWELIEDRDTVPTKPPDDDQRVVDLYRAHDQSHEGPYIQSVDLQP